MDSTRFPRRQEGTTTLFSHAVGRLIEDSLCENTLQNIILLEYPNIPFLEEEAEAQRGYMNGLNHTAGLCIQLLS